MMKSLIIKRSIVIKGHKTSVSLEDAFWHDLKLMAAEENNHCRPSFHRSTTLDSEATFRPHCGCSSLRNIKSMPVRILKP